MNPLHQIQTAIDNLNEGDLQRQKQELLTLVSSFTIIPHSNGHGPHHRLSPREREVMDMILGGRRLKEIAAVLDISVKTVTTHRSRLLRKLGVDDNLGLYRYGVRNGLIAV